MFGTEFRPTNHFVPPSDKRLDGLRFDASNLQNITVLSPASTIPPEPQQQPPPTIEPTETPVPSEPSQAAYSRAPPTPSTTTHDPSPAPVSSSDNRKKQQNGNVWKQQGGSKISEAATNAKMTKKQNDKSRSGSVQDSKSSDTRDTYIGNTSRGGNRGGNRGGTYTSSRGRRGGNRGTNNTRGGRYNKRDGRYNKRGGRYNNRGGNRDNTNYRGNSKTQSDSISNSNNSPTTTDVISFENTSNGNEKRHTNRRGHRYNKYNKRGGRRGRNRGNRYDRSHDGNPQHANNDTTGPVRANPRNTHSKPKHEAPQWIQGTTQGESSEFQFSTDTAFDRNVLREEYAKKYSDSSKETPVHSAYTQDDFFDTLSTTKHKKAFHPSHKTSSE